MASGASILGELLNRIGAIPRDKPVIVAAPAGVGKTPLIAHVALQALEAQQRVLHVSLGDNVEHVRAHYDEVLRAVHGLQGADHATAAVSVERRRMILSYAEREFTPEHLVEQAQMLRDVAHFDADLVIVDGIHKETHERCATALYALGTTLNCPVWLGVSVADALPFRGAHAVLRLLPEADAVHLRLDTPAGTTTLPWVLDAQSLVLAEPGQTTLPTTAVDAASCTLFSGGAGGSEAAFGEDAARFGVHEVNFSFEGHRQVRTEGRTELSPRELEAGDVSLVYVSRRLHREYNQHGLIRRVLQTLWHMVSRAQQVFVIGVIQEDGTVVGGTGWSVELARMWSKELWVYDQTQQGWFTWTGDAWTPGTPRITAAHICGTGTRYLEPHGREAITDLFRRSFPSSG